MKLFRLFVLGMCLMSLPMVITACEQENSIEEGAEEVGDEIDDAM